MRINNKITMPGKNIHKEPFDEGTITKLEIFQRYAREWLPTFVMSQRKRVSIFDFFAGPGYDETGCPGSPIRILQEIKGQIQNIKSNGTIIHLFFNEYDKKKYEQLLEAYKKFIDDNPEMRCANIRITPYNKKFEELYDKLEPEIGQVPSLVYLDQNGIKFIADKYFMSIVRKPQTDFLYYLSSSFFFRFGDTPEFREIVPQATMDEIKEKPYKYIHNEILNYLKSKLPEGSPVRMFPFTIKKNAGVYGIIFGASHIRAADKFLRMAWQINEVNGSANFDIDDDGKKDQLELWGPQPIKKIDAFKKAIHGKIMDGEIHNNKEAFDFAIDKGHIGTHAKEEIAEMKRKKLITYDCTSPKVNYEAAYQRNEIVEYKIVKK